MKFSTISASGTDYTSQATLEAARQADLTGSGPEEVKCCGVRDAITPTLDGWTATPTDWDILQP